MRCACCHASCWEYESPGSIQVREVCLLRVGFYTGLEKGTWFQIHIKMGSEITKHRDRNHGAQATFSSDFTLVTELAAAPMSAKLTTVHPFESGFSEFKTTCLLF